MTQLADKSAPVPDSSDELEKLDSSGEIEQVLGLAESIKLEMENLRSLIAELQARWLIALVFGMITLVAVLVSAYLFTILGTWVRYVLIITTFFTLGVSWAGIYSIGKVLRSFHDRFDTERRALQEVTELVRSLESSYARQEHWSPLKRANFRIRCSRINVQDIERIQVPLLGTARWFL